MPTYVSANQKEFEVPAEGLYLAVCCDVVEHGIVETSWGPRDEIELRWQLEAHNSKGVPFEVRQRYRRSLNEKAKLRQHLELWRGRKFTSAELQKFDLDVLLGKPCQIQVVHNLDDQGRTWANVQAVIAAPKNVTALAVSKDYVRVKDRPTEQGVAPSAATPPDEDDDIPF